MKIRNETDPPDAGSTRQFSERLRRGAAALLPAIWMATLQTGCFNATDRSLEASDADPIDGGARAGAEKRDPDDSEAADDAPNDDDDDDDAQPGDSDDDDSDDDDHDAQPGDSDDAQAGDDDDSDDHSDDAQAGDDDDSDDHSDDAQVGDDDDANDDDALDDSDAGTKAECLAPDAQLLDFVVPGATLTFTLPDGSPVEVGMSTDLDATRPDAWRAGPDFIVPGDGAAYIKVFARHARDRCDHAVFEQTYALTPEFPPAAGQPGSTAIALDDPRIVGWASGFAPPEYGDHVDDTWRTPELALGPASTEPYHICVLGRGGQLTLTFDPPIGNGEGPDFLVFENSFSDTFLELAWVEVSSDGETFVRFDSSYLGESEVSQFGTQSPTSIEGLAGKYRQGFGQPFDLNLLRYRAAVQRGLVELDAITHVRLVDVVGDGEARDSFGHTIYDPYPTSGSAGFDLDAVGVLNVSPSGK